MWYLDRNAAAIAAFALAAAFGFTPDASAASTRTGSKPMLSFSADRTSVPNGGTIALSWASANVTSCTASGAWSGSQSTSGTYKTAPLAASSSFTLTCKSARGKVEKSVAVEVAPLPATTEPTTPTTEPTTTTTTPTSTTTTEPTTTTTTTTSTTTTEPTTTTTTTPTSTTTTEPTTTTTTTPTSTTTEPTATTPTVTPRLALQASTSAVRTGESVTLTWTGEAVSNCQASGSWSGTRAASGTELRSQLTATENYRLTCDSAGGQIVAMTSVQVWSGGTGVTWAPPTLNADGTPLTDLAGYRIYVGTISRDYYQQIQLNDVSATQHFLELLPGEYYIAMSALDMEGNESALSNEVRKLVQ